MQKKKGISLIVLVITIIVMIILAAAIILSLNNAGIIRNANKAVNDSNMANIKSAADLAYAEYLIDKPKGVTDLGAYLTQKLIDNNTITGDDYIIGICDNETVVAKAGTVAYEYYKGNIQIGEYVNYDPTKGIEDVSSIKYTSPIAKNGYADQEFTLEGSYDSETYGWQVMGINKDGELLIVSKDYIQPVNGGINKYNRNFFVVSGEVNGEINAKREVQLTGIGEIENICDLYGKGYGATEARGITIEDVNKITGYNPDSIGNKTGKKFYNGIIGEYGSTATFYWKNIDGDIKLYYECSNGDEGYSSTEHTVFEWFENGVHHKEDRPTNLAEGKKQKITTIKSTYYTYYPETLTENNQDAKVGKVKDGTLEYDVLFIDGTQTNTNLYYWLSSSFVYTGGNQTAYGINCVNIGWPAGNLTFTSNGVGGTHFGGIRPVVSLSKDIVLESSGTKMVGDIQVNVYDIK